MILTLSLIIICSLLYVLKKRKDGNYWKNRGVPFEKPLPFVGNTLASLLLRKNIGIVMADLYFKHVEPFFGIWVFNRPQLLIKCPDLIRHILVKDFNYFYDRHVECIEEFDEFSANMMLFMKYPKWKFFRTKTTPMFSSGKMKHIYPLIQAVAKSMVAFIDTNASKKSIEVYDVCAKYTTQVVYTTAFGVDPQSFQERETPFVSLGKTVFTINLLNVVSMLAHYCKSSLVKVFKFKLIDPSTVKFLKDFFFDVVEKRKLAKGYRGDVIDFLIKFREENNLQDNEIVAQMAQFLVAGYETTNMTISLAVYEISLNKHIQQKLREEIYLSLDKDGDISYSSLNAMVYLDKIIHETLRKYPVVPLLGRTCVRNYKIPNSAVVIEKGVEVIISLSGLHHDPKYYPSPEVFNPERFEAENTKRRHPYTYMPFGEGQRNCIGQRVSLLLMKLGIAHIIKSFEIDICDERIKPLKFNPRKFTLSVNGGIYVQFTKID